MTAESPWVLSWAADPVVAKLADGHYSRQKPGTDQFSPPGRKLVMKTPDGLAGWVTSWPFPQFVNRDWKTAWVNTLFCKRGGGVLGQRPDPLGGRPHPRPLAGCASGRDYHHG